MKKKGMTTSDQPSSVATTSRGGDKKTSKKDSKDKTSPSKGKIICLTCKKKCSGEVLRVQDKYFHISCFKCKVCKSSLAQGGFFNHEGAYYCTADYQRQFGTKCVACGEYVEGEVVTALGNTYHQRCFTCSSCRKAFPSGDRVTYNGRQVLCQRCSEGGPKPVAQSPQIQQVTSGSPAVPNSLPLLSSQCAGCQEELKEGQALVALDRQWHVTCFKCQSCGVTLQGEYMGKDGIPYCEKDYQKQFGVKCAYCSRYISGKVLQAGENHHFHPTCARCTKCGDPFGDGEEMFLQGGAIWHPRCGPGPTENGAILNGNGSAIDAYENGARDGYATTDTEGGFDHMSSAAPSEMQFSLRSRTPSLNGSVCYSPHLNSLNRKFKHLQYRSSSPGLILREYKHPEDISRIYTYSYLTEEPNNTSSYLRRPIDPYDKPPTSPHFHRPHSAQSSSRSRVLLKHGSRSAMQVLVDSIKSETPRPKSPHMNNEEPIELAHFPAAKRPPPGEKSKIERDDFPAPPYPYTDPERRRRWSDSYKGVPLSDDENGDVQQSPGDEVDAKVVDVKLKREEVELSKIATGIGKVFLQNVREREKMRQWKMSHLDPRNASRTPSAAKEPINRLRYESPINASPSRNMDHPRPWEEDQFDRSSSYRSSVGRSTGAIPSYNAPKPGYGLKSSTLPANGRNGFYSPPGVYSGGDFSFSGLGEKTQSTEFSSGKSDISGGSISEVDRRALGGNVTDASSEFRSSTTFGGGIQRCYPAFVPAASHSYSPHLRRSLPTLNHSMAVAMSAASAEPPKLYPYHLLMTTNYRLPGDVDRLNLERHLSDSEFEMIFHVPRMEFYRMPQWKRNDLKRRALLF
ncbi:actin-binding LIM protein 3-like isoform X3 [Cloeon dipterum]|uniref:actin-binding LIM protein 3-like isoform X3 n=1 Tax=Cloeon dipterum TaxID=197152 RepID=UPI00321FFF3E